jgi:adenylate cyclase
VKRQLRAFLRKQGATPAEITEAEREERLALLTIDRLLLPGEAKYTYIEAAARAGMDVDHARRLWRALGFADPPTDARRFTADDVGALIALREQADQTVVASDDQYDELVQRVRAIGGALSRIAEIQSDRVVETVEEGRLAGLSDAEIAAQVPESLDWARIAGLIDYGVRLQLRAALWRKLAGPKLDEDGSPQLAVGFVDLVGYTALSQELADDELADLVARFDAVAYDTVAEHGVRVVKTIGDEVMFVGEDIGATARAALALSQRTAAEDLLPNARAGVAAGPVLAYDGDYYGPIVNLASRLVDIARPGSVLVDGTVREALEGDDDLDFRRLRTRRLRDIGRTEINLLRPARTPAEAD